MATGSSVKGPTKTAPPKENYLLSTILTVVAVVIAVMILRIHPLPGTWAQNYDPTGRWWLSTILASLPVIVWSELIVAAISASFDNKAPMRVTCSRPLL